MESSQAAAGALAFSLFCFPANEEGGSESTYELLLQAARFADEHGFEAIWTPERHFHSFGGLYPNPAVTAAAIAATTRNIAIRPGACVLPLHPTVRVAEDWAVIDNLSGGRVGIAFAAGWQPNDFVLNPLGYEDNRERLEAGVREVQRLWRGERVEMTDGKGKSIAVRTLPRPVQAELPTWITAAGSVETFRLAGRMGANLLTHLLGQSFEELADKLDAYRESWQQAGHPGAQGRVTLMLHTFVAETDAEAEAASRQPLKGYMASAADLVRKVAWSFPVFQGQLPTDDDMDILEGLSAEDVDAVLEHGFQRYYQGSSMIGSVERCRRVAARARAMGVDEIACLIDFGVDRAAVMEALPRLDAVRRAFAAGGMDDSEERPFEAVTGAAAEPAEAPASATADPAAQPAGDLEASIGVIWTAMLGHPVDTHANLFDSGGNSLVAVRLHRRLRDELGLNVKLTDVFRFPTIAQLAGHLSSTTLGGGDSRGAQRAELAAARRGRSR